VQFIRYDIGDIMTCDACGEGNAYPSGAPDFTSGFHRGSRCPIICVSFHVIFLSFRCLSFDCSFCFIAWYLYFFLLKTVKDQFNAHILQIIGRISVYCRRPIFHANILGEKYLGFAVD